MGGVGHGWIPSGSGPPFPVTPCSPNVCVCLSRSQEIAVSSLASESGSLPHHLTLMEIKFPFSSVLWKSE